MGSILDLSKKHGLQTNWVSNIHKSTRLDPWYYSPIFVNTDEKLKQLAQHFSLTSISAACNVSYGHMPLEDYVTQDNGAPFIRVTNIKDNLFIDVDDMKYIPSDVVKNEHILGHGDILIVQNGFSTGKIAFCTKNVAGYIYPSFCLRLHNFTNNIDSAYLATYLLSYYGQIQILRGIKVGSVHPNTTKPSIEDIELPLPPRPIQEYIGNKIRKAEELREEARRLKKEAEDIIYSELMLNDLQDIYSTSKRKALWVNQNQLQDRLEPNYYNEQYVKIKDYVNNLPHQKVSLNHLVEKVFTGKKIIDSSDGVNCLFIQSGAISNNNIDLKKASEYRADMTKNRIVNYGDLLFAKDGATIGKLAPNFNKNNLIINEHLICLALKQEYKKYTGYLFCYFTNSFINQILVCEATGTAQKGLSIDFVDRIQVPLIDEELASAIQDKVEKRCKLLLLSDELINEAKQDVEDLIEGKFDESKITA